MTTVIEDDANPYGNEESIPDDVVDRGGSVSEEMARMLYDRTARNLSGVGGFDIAETYRTVMSNGDTPTDLFAKTFIKDEAHAVRMAKAFASRADEMRTDPYWSKEEWLKADSQGLIFYNLLMIFYRAINQRAAMQGLQAHTGILVPELNKEPTGRGNKWRPFFRRKPAPRQDDGQAQGRPR